MARAKPKIKTFFSDTEATAALDEARNLLEKQTGVRPSISGTVSMLIKRGLADLKKKLGAA